MTTMAMTAMVMNDLPCHRKACLSTIHIILSSQSVSQCTWSCSCSCESKIHHHVSQHRHTSTTSNRLQCPMLQTAQNGKTVQHHLKYRERVICKKWGQHLKQQYSHRPPNDICIAMEECEAPSPLEVRIMRDASG